MSSKGEGEEPRVRQDKQEKDSKFKEKGLELYLSHNHFVAVGNWRKGSPAQPTCYRKSHLIVHATHVETTPCYHLYQYRPSTLALTSRGTRRYESTHDNQTVPLRITYVSLQESGPYLVRSSFRMSSKGTELGSEPITIGRWGTTQTPSNLGLVGLGR